MGELADSAAFGARLLTGALVLAIVYRLLTGGFRASGLLQGRDRRSSPVRIQLLLATLLVAGTYLTLASGAIAEGAAALPAPPTLLLWILAASHAVYLAREAYLRLS